MTQLFNHYKIIKTNQQQAKIWIFKKDEKQSSKLGTYKNSLNLKLLSKKKATRKK